MNFKTITPISTEPISLLEAKSHLRIDSSSFSDDITPTQSIAPGLHVVASSYSLIGISVDVLGYMALVLLEAGTCGTGGTVDVKIQESDDNLTWTDWTGGAFTQVTTANDNATYKKEYTGTKQYIRVVSTVAVASCEFAVSVLKDAPTSSEDTQLSSWITTAREYGETFTGRSFATKTLELLLEQFPDKDYIELPFPPLQSVTSIKYKNSAGTETTLTENTDYLVDLDRAIGRIVLPYSKTWATFTAYTVNPIRIRFVAGYTSIPKTCKSAMLFHVGLLYKYRDNAIPEDEIKTLNDIYKPYKLGSKFWGIGINE